MDELTSQIRESWQAGFFDGEGCITLPRHPSLIISVTNTNPDAISEYINDYPGYGISNIKGKPNGSPAYNVYWVNYHARYILEALLPYLVLKKESARLALEFLAGWGQFIPLRIPSKGRCPRYSSAEIEYCDKYRRLIKEQTNKNTYFAKF